jgi:hypothetical protein
VAAGERADAPAAYVRAADIRVERLEQSYLRVGDVGGRRRYDTGLRLLPTLVYDEHRLILDYPGIARRTL